MRRVFRSPEYDNLAAMRAAEIDEVLEEVASFGPKNEDLPAKIGVMFESLLLGYAMLTSRRGERRRVLLGQEAYDRAKATGLIAWCAEHYPNLTFEPPRQGIQGLRPTAVIYDEIASFQ